MIIVVHKPTQQELTVVIHAEDGLRFGFGFRERGQEEPGKDGNDGDHDEQFDEGEAPRCTAHTVKTI